MLYLLLSLVGLAFGGIVVERPDSQTSDWTELQRSDSSKEIELWFSIKNENLETLYDTLLDVSTPGNSDYGNFRSIPELRRMIAPTKFSINTITSWLDSNDLEYTVTNDNSDLLSVTTTIGAAENLLECEYYDYKSKVDDETIVSRVKLGSDYHVPSSDIADSLWFIAPTHRFPLLRQRLKVTGIGAVQQTPTTLRALYNVGDAAGKTNADTGIASFRGQEYDIADCRLMWTDYKITPDNVTNVPSDQGSGHHLEAELDTQYMSSMGQSVPMQVWLTSGVNFPNALMQWTEDVLASKTAPLLFSVSYGGPESAFGESFVLKLNSQFALMGTAGTSVMFASGDSGAGGGCTTGAFEPDYPACSSFVTAVGGVQGGTAGKVPVGESAWSDGGGGFSNYAAQQPWQTTAVAYYLNNENNLPAPAKYNKSGRAFPDIAAQSVDFLIYVGGRKEGVSGTSCASPTAGGIFGLLNDLRIQNKMAPLGFLNPFIYQTAAKDPTAFNDCTTGYNKGCGAGISRGFNAYAKWDPASGYGSPNYKVLATYVTETGKQTLGSKFKFKVN